MLGEIAMWQVAIMLSVPVTRNKSQSYKVTARSSLIDSQAGAHSTLVQHNGRVFILVTALTISTGHTAATAGCGEHIMRVGRCYATIIVCGHAPLVPGY